MRYWVQLATEQFPPSNLIEQAVEAERAGFDAVNVSDHFQPWWEPGHSGMAWALLGAIGHATERVEVGTGVTAPVHRYHPALVAQFAATMEEMCPGRAFLGIGSGESLNESPCGMDWPDTAEQVARMDEALEADRPPARRRAGRPRGPFLSHQGRLPSHARRAAATDIRIGVRPRCRRGGCSTRRRPVDAGRPRDGPRPDRGLPLGLRRRGAGGRRDHPSGRLLLGAGRRQRPGGCPRVETDTARRELHRRPPRSQDDVREGRARTLRRRVQAVVHHRLRPGAPRRAHSRDREARSRRSCAFRTARAPIRSARYAHTGSTC